MNIFKQILKLLLARYASKTGQKKVAHVVDLFDGLRKQVSDGRAELLKADSETMQRILELQEQREGYEAAVRKAERVFDNLTRVIDG